MEPVEPVWTEIPSKEKAKMKVSPRNLQNLVDAPDLKITAASIPQNYFTAGLSISCGANIRMD